MTEQIVIKELTDGTPCLYDTRSCKFFKGGGIRNDINRSKLLDLANTVVRKPFRQIVEMAQNPVFNDNGFCEFFLAKRYVELNPDILLKVNERKKAKANGSSEPKEPKTFNVGGKRGRGRPRKNPVEELEPSTVAVVVGEKRGRGRPRKNPIVSEDKTMNVVTVTTGEKRGRGRPRKNPIEAVQIGEKRGRGRPRKNPIEAVQIGEKRGRGRPRKNPEAVVVGEKRGRGRPRKNPVEAVAVPKRGPGRPPKNKANEIVINGVTYVVKA